MFQEKWNNVECIVELGETGKPGIEKLVGRIGVLCGKNVV
jgi:hypothetical protein